MDLPEGKQALREIKSLEEGVERRLKEARQRAQEIVSRARAEADERIRLKEGELAQLRCRLDSGARAPAGAAAPPPENAIVPNKAAVAGLAREIFNAITGR